jgi:nitrate reductase gamma subunit
MVINRMKTTNTTRAMKLRYIYTLLTLISVLYFAPANAQTKPKAKSKKTTTKVVVKKTTAKKPAKKVVKKAEVIQIQHLLIRLIKIAYLKRLW